MKTPNGSRRLSADKRYGGDADARPAPSARRSGGGGNGGGNGGGGGLPPQKARHRAPEPPKKPRRGNLVTRGVAGTFGLIWKVIWGSFWRTFATLALILGLSVGYFYSTLPAAQALFDGRARGSVTMLDTDGRVFAWRGETYNTVGADKIAPVLRDAVVATEDKRFYTHLGIDPRGIASAIKINMAEGRGPLEGNGGSTITQQVSKLLCLGDAFDPTRWKSEAEYEAECRKSTLWRKVKEIPYALAMEAKYSKDDILNIYMNRSYLGAGARGFEAASQRYFGKPASEVTASEAAMLAGLLKAPSYFSPTSNLQRSQDRASVILGLMHDQGFLNDTQFAEAKANPATLSRAAAARAGGYFADWVMESGPGFLTTETTEDVTITTTFDQHVQRAAERALARVFDEKVKGGSKAQAAVVVMSADGAVRAMIGGRDTAAAGSFNRATQAKRQPGSAFKPFIYAAALDQGFGPNDTIQDSPLTIYVKGSGPWSPKNYTRNYKGTITLTTALAQSINTAAIRLQEAVGRDNVRRVAQDFGFAHDMTKGPSLGLGVSESTLLEMTGAYAGIRNGGTAVRPYGLVELRIKGDDKPLMGQVGGMGERVISPKAASELIWMMKQVVESGTGKRAQLPGGREVAGKTGTTSSYRDAWFIGFTEQYVTGVWMGYDDNKPLKDVTGGGLPAEIWQAVMAEIHEGLPMKSLDVVAPGGAGSAIAASDVISTDANDPLAAALAEAVAAAQPVEGQVATSVEIARPGDVEGRPLPPAGGDALDAAIAEAMGQGGGAAVTVNDSSAGGQPAQPQGAINLAPQPAAPEPQAAAEPPAADPVPVDQGTAATAAAGGAAPDAAAPRDALSDALSGIPGLN